MKWLRYGVIVAILVCQSAIARESPSCPKVMEYVQNRLSHFGTLKHSGKLVYLDVDDDYIDQLVSLIRAEGFDEPPRFGNEDSVGTHIIVIYPEEIERYGIGDIPEVGQIIYFIPKECIIANPLRWESIDEVYIIVIEAPELDWIRTKYKLPKREQDFHITIGVKPKIAIEKLIDDYEDFKEAAPDHRKLN